MAQIDSVQGMPSRAEIVTFHDTPPPCGKSAWVAGTTPRPGVSIVAPDPAWSQWYAELESRVRMGLGWRVLNLEHVGSTSVPGLAAKPVIDLDLTVADPDDEAAYIPALESAGFELCIREPWWYGHRVLRATEPPCNIHVFGYDSPEPIKHRIFREWLRGNPADLVLYAQTKRQAAEVADAGGEDVMQYNARKERTIREIYNRAFVAAGLLDE